MIIVSYDISDNKLRAQFSKFLEQHGVRIQYSVFELRNSARILSLIKLEINNNFESQFSQSDSVVVFSFSKENVSYYGNSKNWDKSLISL